MEQHPASIFNYLPPSNNMRNIENLEIILIVKAYNTILKAVSVNSVNQLKVSSVYSGEIVPMFRRNGYHCSGGTIPSVRNRIP